MKFSYKNLQVLGDASAGTVTNLWHCKHVPSELHEKNKTWELFDPTTYMHIKTIF